MPLYEFECQRCGEIFEKLVGSLETDIVCPKCLSAGAEKKLSCPSPLKKGAFPFKPGPVHPLGKKMARAASGEVPSKSCPGACSRDDD